MGSILDSGITLGDEPNEQVNNTEGKLSRIKDADTFVVDNGEETTVRLEGVDAPESDTPAGEDATMFVEAAFSQGVTDGVAAFERGRFGTFGRTVSPMAVDGVDLGFVVLDQGYSDYATQWGEARDPDLHKDYTPYFSEDTPLAFGEIPEPMSAKDKVDIEAKYTELEEAKAEYKDSGNNERLQAAVKDLYTDKGKVARYRESFSQWNNPDPTKMTPIAYAVAQSAQDPERREQINRAIRNNAWPDYGRDMNQEADLLDKVGASWDSWSLMSNLMDVERTNYARGRAGDEGETIPVQDLLVGQPSKFHAMIQNEYKEHGQTAALVMSQQLQGDLANREITDDFGFVENLGFGLLSYVADPVGVITGGFVAGATARGLTWGATQVATRNAALGQLASAETMAGVTLGNGAKLAQWSAVGYAESAVHNAPRLIGDFTYTPEEYYLENAYSALFGGGLYAVGKGGKAALDYRKQKITAKQEEMAGLEANVDKRVAERAAPKAHPLDEADTIDVLHTDSRISREAFKVTSKKLSSKFGKKTPLGKLFNQHVKLSDKNLHPDLETEVEKLGVDILRLAMQFPDGNIKSDDAANKVISKLLWRQQQFRTNSAVSDILQGNSNNPAKDLDEYVNVIKRDSVFEGLDTKATSLEDIEKTFGDLLSREVVENVDESFATAGLPKEISQLQDIIELNKAARESGSLVFENAVEELNGLLKARLTQKLDDPDTFKLPMEERKKLPKQVKQTDQEVLEGLLEGRKDRSQLIVTDQGIMPYDKALAKSKELIKSLRKKADKHIKKNKLTGELRKEYLAQTKSRMNKRLKSLGLPIPKPLGKGELKQWKKDNKHIKLAEELRDVGKAEEVEVGKVFKEDTPEGYEPIGFETSSEKVQARNTQDEVRLTREEIQSELRREEIEAIANDQPFDVTKRGNELEKFGHDALSETSTIQRKDARDRVDQGTTLTKDIEGSPLFPTSVNVNKSFDVFNKPDAHGLAEVRKQINKLIDSKETPDALTQNPKQYKKDYLNPDKRVHAERERQRKRMEGMKRSLENKPERIQKMIDTDDLETIELIVRASNTVARQEKLKATKLKESAVEGEVVKDAPEATPLTKEDFDDTIERTPAQQVDREAKQKAAIEQMEEESREKLANELAFFTGSGKEALLKSVLAPKHALDAVGRLATVWSKDLGRRFLESDLTSLKYVGLTIAENGQGFGGFMKRDHTAAVIRETEMFKSLGRVAAPYVDAVKQYSASKGENWLQQKQAAWGGNSDQATKKAFDREVFAVLQAKRHGKDVPEGTHKSVTDFVDKWEGYTSHAHERLVKAGVDGFRHEKKVAHYIPHIWMEGQIKGLITKNGEQEVIDTLVEGILSANRSGRNDISKRSDAERYVREDLLEGVMRADKDAEFDIVSPIKDARAKTRVDIDTSVTHNGISVMDMLDDDVIGIAHRYSNRAAGWIGLAKATKGTITGHLDVKTLRESIRAETLEKGGNADKNVQLYDDLINMVMGRPVRGGLAPELRMVKDLAVLSKMGGLGTAQLIESGQVVTRGMLNMFSDPKTIKKIYDTVGADVESVPLMKEIQSISGISDDMEYFSRQATHLDEATQGDIGKARKLSQYVVDKGTGGKHKAIASRALNQINMFDYIKKTQSRVVQSSFAVDVAKHFRDGTGKMGNARMADVGLTDPLGQNAKLKQVFDEIVEFNEDGTLKRLHADKWPEDVFEEFSYAMGRDEAQQIQRSLPGEEAPWLNPPLMGLLFQFRQFAMTAQNKQLMRSMAFADREAVTNVMLNAAMAGMVRWSKFAVLGAGAAVITGETWEAPEAGDKRMDTAKYISQFGIYADVYDLVMTNRDTDFTDPHQAWGAIEEQIATLSLAQDYIGTTGHLPEEEQENKLNHLKGITALGNTQLGDMIFLIIQEMLEDD